MPVNWNGDEVARRVRSAAMTGVIAGTELVKETAIKSIQSGNKSGRIYQRRGITHQASAPGEPPASDTGRLVQSTQTQFDTGELLGQVVFRTAYAAPLEFGTSRIEPRPYARPALEANRDKISQAIEREVSKVL